MLGPAKPAPFNLIEKSGGINYDNANNNLHRL